MQTSISPLPLQSRYNIHQEAGELVLVFRTGAHSLVFVLVCISSGKTWRRWKERWKIHPHLFHSSCYLTRLPHGKGMREHSVHNPHELRQCDLMIYHPRDMVEHPELATSQPPQFRPGINRPHQTFGDLVYFSEESPRKRTSVWQPCPFPPIWSLGDPLHIHCPSVSSHMELACVLQSTP